MASTVATQKLSTTLKAKGFDLDPDATTLTDVGFEDMSEFETLLVLFQRTVGVSAIVFNIVANPESDGSGTDAIVKTHVFANGQPNAVGDVAFLELTAQEIAALGTDLRFVSANISFATGTDEAVVTYIFGGARYARELLTDDSIA